MCYYYYLDSKPFLLLLFGWQAENVLLLLLLLYLFFSSPVSCRWMPAIKWRQKQKAVAQHSVSATLWRLLACFAHTQIVCKSGELSFSSTLTFAFSQTRALNKKLPRVTPAFFGCRERERILVLEGPSSFTSGNSGNYSIVSDFCDSKWHRTEHWKVLWLTAAGGLTAETGNLVCRSRSVHGRAVMHL